MNSLLVIICSVLSAGPLDAVPIDGAPFSAALVSVEKDGTLVFQDSDTKRPLTPKELTRFGHPAQISRSTIVALTDGGWLVADRATLDAQGVHVEGLFGEIVLPRNDVSAIALSLPGSSERRDPLVTKLTRLAQTDHLNLRNGDRVEGVVTAITRSQVTLQSAGSTLQLPRDRIATIAWRRKPVEKRSPMLVGLTDGSMLYAKRLITDPKIRSMIRIELPSNVQPAVLPEDICYLQPLDQGVVYLSDLDDADYRHVPYLSIRKPFGRDALASGLRLRAGGQLYAKGVSMPSASRLSYLTRRQYSRFQAMVAIDDSTDGEGSVRMRVFLDGKEAYQSEIVRGGDAPLPIDLDLKDVIRLDLIVEYANRLDQFDRALWLDARLVK